MKHNYPNRENCSVSYILHLNCLKNIRERTDSHYPLYDIHFKSMAQPSEFEKIKRLITNNNIMLNQSIKKLIFNHKEFSKDFAMIRSIEREKLIKSNRLLRNIMREM